MSNKNVRNWVAVFAALLVITVVFFRGNIINWFQGARSAAPATVDGTDISDAIAQMTQGELTLADVTLGQGDEAQAGQTVSVHYVGLLQDGTKFDSSRDRGESFTFVLGTGQVIPGFDAAVTGMRVGGTRRVVIPPAQGYGAQQVGSIPANSALLFEIELLGIN